MVEREPAIAVVAMGLEEDSPAETIHEIAFAGPPTGVVALTAAPLDGDVVARALAAGAHACVTPRSIAEHGSAPFTSTTQGQIFLPDREVLEGGTISEMLYLRSNGDIYVLVEPCDGSRVDYVSAGATRLTVIDLVVCD